MNNKTENAISQAEEKLGIKLSAEAKEKLLDGDTLTKIMKKLSPSDIAAVASVLSGKDGLSALSQNKELLERLKKSLEE